MCLYLKAGMENTKKLKTMIFRVLLNLRIHKNVHKKYFRQCSSILISASFKLWKVTFCRKAFVKNTTENDLHLI